MLHRGANPAIALIAATILAAVVSACGSSAASSGPGTASPDAGAATQAPGTTAGPATAVPTLAPGATPTPAPTGFVFAADDIAAFYESRGYACTGPQPSAKAAGYTFRTCEAVENGRTIVVGLATDPGGELGDAWASVQAPAGVDFLEPTDALGPLAGFLGVTLGEDRADAALDWLAGHLGDDYDSTTSGSLTVATYIPSPDDHTRIYVEVANDGYLQASPGT